MRGMSSIGAENRHKGVCASLFAGVLRPTACSTDLAASRPRPNMDSARAAHSDAAETTDSEAGGRCQLGFTLSVTWQLRGIHRFSVPLLLRGLPLSQPRKLFAMTTVMHGSCRLR